MLSYEPIHLPLRRPPPGRHALWVSRKPVSFNRGRELNQSNWPHGGFGRFYIRHATGAAHLAGWRRGIHRGHGSPSIPSAGTRIYIYCAHGQNLSPHSVPVADQAPNPTSVSPASHTSPRVHKRAVHRLLRSVGGSQRQGGILNLNQFTST